MPEADAAFPALADRDALPGPYRASVLRIIDGDTFEARLRVWFGQDVTVAVRIRGFDAPELKSKCPRDMALAQEARAALGAALAALYDRLGELDRPYAELSRDERIALLSRELAGRRPLSGAAAAPPARRRLSTRAAPRCHG